ncbi:MAG: FAD-dependent monooxygenase, partial [Clostridia bacterium]
MIKVNEIKLPICYSDGDVVNALSYTLRVRPSDITHFEVVKRSIDSRKKDDIHYTLSIAVDIKEEGKFLAQNRNAKVNHYTRPMTTFDELMLTCAVRKTQSRPVIVGSGPCGLFAGLTLAKAGLRPIILERGKDVDARKLDVEKFYKSGQLNTESNIQFGEGGAGAFSDGKLNTGVG